MSILWSALIIVRWLIEIQRRLNDRDSEGGFLPPRGHWGWEPGLGGRWLVDQHIFSSVPKSHILDSIHWVRGILDFEGWQLSKVHYPVSSLKVSAASRPSKSYLIYDKYEDPFNQTLKPFPLVTRWIYTPIFLQSHRKEERMQHKKIFTLHIMCPTNFTPL